MSTEQDITRFKMELLRKMPFYGDVVMRLPIVRNDRVGTACTNGGRIEYSGRFFDTLSTGQINFVLMHEILHVLLFHCSRGMGKNPTFWNAAADMVVNSMLQKITSDMRSMKIPFDRPPAGIFINVDAYDTVENLYEIIRRENAGRGAFRKSVTVPCKTWGGFRNADVEAPSDLIPMPLPRAGEKNAQDGGKNGLPANEVPDGGQGAPDAPLSEETLLQVIRESATKNRSDFGSYFVPDQVFGLTESKRIKWSVLLREYLTEEQSDEASYTTPERKYIHMDLILPGYSSSETKLEEIWAFVDSSGSIGKNEMDQFLTQLYRIAKEFKCTFNICYWDTRVTDVYRDIKKEEEILTSLPKHSGGTDVNCVYRWLGEQNIRPDVMLILTDGYFGSLNNSSFIPSLRRKTILVLSGTVGVNDDMHRIGQITRLE